MNKVIGIRGLALFMREKYGTLVKDNEEAIRRVFQSIKEALKENDAVSITGYLKIVKRQKPARKGTNPQTGEELLIKEHTGLTYKTGKLMKDFLNKD